MDEYCTGRNDDMSAITIKLPLLPTVIAGGLAAGTGTAIGLEALLTPRAEARTAAGEAWQDGLDDYVAEHPVPDGTTLRTSTTPPSVAAINIGMGSAAIGILGAGTALAFPTMPHNKAVMFGSIALGVGGLAGSLIGYNAIK